MQNKIIAIIFITLSALTLYAKDENPKLMTKQDLSRIRYLTQDSRFTYYQDADGDLRMATDAKVISILKGKPGTNYAITSSDDRKTLLISQTISLYDYYSLRRDANIYTSKLATPSSTFVGLGISAKFHGNDEWVSFYTPNEHTIKIVNVKNSTIKFNIILKNKLNPYFIPQIIMKSNGVFYYTDINDNGQEGILSFDKTSQKISSFYTCNNSYDGIELLVYKDRIFAGKFPKIRNKESAIMVFEPNGKINEIYNSPYTDFGKMVILDDELFFIKTILDPKKKEFSDVFSIDLQDQSEPLQESELNFVTQFVLMDGALFVAFRGDYFVVRGELQKREIKFINKKK